jgi:hypothetical protein
MDMLDFLVNCPSSSVVLFNLGKGKGIMPQTGIIFGVTANSVASQQVYFPAFNGQKGPTILERRASELTVLHTYPASWNLIARHVPQRGLLAPSHPAV